MAAPATIIPTVEQLLLGTAGLSICYDRLVPPTPGAFEPVPASLHPELLGYLKATYPNGLYRHQRVAIDLLCASTHTVVSTRTSSGKSLIYSVPVLNRLLCEPDATALFLFPQKALANDQLQRLIASADAIPTLRARRATKPHLIARYDGATAQDLRKAIRPDAQVVMTNPDMLHQGILAWHEQHWQRFFSRLRYVVVDECHDYRGIFGTNVSYVLRRLRAVCRRHGSDPTFVATSATVHAPQDHMERLTGLPFTCVGADQDGSQQGGRKFWMVQSDTDHPYDAGRKLTLALAERGLTVLTFCLSRTAAERMMARAGRDNRDAESPFVRVYRAGLTAEAREEIEAGLRNRTVRAVFATSALELGIDIGALDVVLCVGLPPTAMSMWQRAGRAGRAGKEGAVILIPGETPIDAYHAAHPDDLFCREHEPLVLSLCNQRVVRSHYACAVKEVGDESKLDVTVLGPEMAAVKAERDAGTLDDPVFYIDQPHHATRIRSGGEEPYRLVCDGADIGEIDPFHLLREAPRNGIYLHGGVRYRVQDVRKSERRVQLARELRPHYTTPFIQTTINLRRMSGANRHGRVLIARARLDVTDFLVSVTEKHISGDTIRCYQGNGGMPNHHLPTEGTVVRLEPGFWAEFAGAVGELASRAALDAAARLFGSLFPTVTGPCDASDYSAAAYAPKNAPPALYLYDTVPWGVGLSVGAFERVAELVSRAEEQVRECPCDADEGCFRCIRNPHAEVQASKAATRALLQKLASELALPAVVIGSVEDDPPAPTTSACPGCSVPQSQSAKFCSNCGTKLQPSP